MPLVIRKKNNTRCKLKHEDANIKQIEMQLYANCYNRFWNLEVYKIANVPLKKINCLEIKKSSLEAKKYILNHVVTSVLIYDSESWTNSSQLKRQGNRDVIQQKDLFTYHAVKVLITRKLKLKWTNKESLYLKSERNRTSGTNRRG